MSSYRLHRLGLSALLLVACGDSEGQTGQTGQTGFETSNCIDNQCLGALVCVADFCVNPDNATSTPISNTNVTDPGVTDGSATGPITTEGFTTGPTTDPTTNPTTVDPSTTTPVEDTTTTDPSGDPSTSPSDPSTTTGSASDSDPGTSTTLPPDNTTETTAPPPECKQFDAELVVPTVMLVLDKSGTMTANPGGLWDHDNNANTATIFRWKSLHKVLSAILPMYDDAIEFGSILFGSKAATSNYDQSACVVEPVPEAQPAPGNTATILATLPLADAIVKGGSPTAKAVQAALTQVLKAPADVPRAIVLAVDGPANCKANAPNNSDLFETYDETLHTVVSGAWNSNQIPTYVIGLDIQNVTSPTVKDGTPDNTNPYTRLNELAVQGGRPRVGEPKFYQTTDEAELTAAYTTIFNDLQSCVLTLDDVPVDKTNTMVIVGGKSYAYNNALNCANASGWLYTDASNTKIQLCGTACTALKSQGFAEIKLDCP